jgi:hypothetical protein
LQLEQGSGAGVAREDDADEADLRAYASRHHVLDANAEETEPEQ